MYLNGGWRTRCAGVLAIAALGVPLAACGSDGDGGATSAGGPGGGEEVRVALITGLRGLAFYTSMRCGAEDAARELGGVELSVQDPPQFNPSAQTPLVQGAVQRGIDGMVVVPTDPRAMGQPIRTAMNRDVEVIAVDATLEPPITPQTIITDNITAGRLAARAMARAIGPRGGKVQIIGLNPAVTGNQQRVEGFQQEIEANHPEIELLEVQYNQTADQNRAASQVAAAVRANPDLRGIYTTNEASGVGAASALLSTGKRGEVQLISYDAGPQQVRGLKDGTYAALVVQKPYQLGYDGIKNLVGVLRGELDRAELERDVLVPPVIATRENVDDPEVARYLYVDKC
ncbi:ABC transporter substrate-binding protein [Conexibacter arvalis]|uniref:Ribose transport system substrate-binding protein n=1 Tax=Conexibacter arvalis TaxID=912552 RepID=A0A840IBZ3_9ACTN|nr:ABC transporter substrate-binding protein [Conexibacter arvalis]MBB4662409.1 ribose transport system substrate-binding protein [Conexibacter arvalis]